MRSIFFLELIKGKIRSRMKAPYMWFYGAIFVAVLDVCDFIEYCLGATQSLADNWPMKTVISGSAVTALTYLNSPYGDIFMAYFWIVVIDIWTKWLAIGYKHLVEQGMPADQITMRDRFSGIVLAFDAKKLTSAQMMWGFLGKFVLFSFLLFMAYHADIILTQSGIQLSWPAVKFMLAYVCYNEMLSIAENLRDAGNEHMDKLVDILNTNIFSKIKR